MFYFSLSLLYMPCLGFVKSYGLNSWETLTRAHSSSLATLGFKWLVVYAKNNRDSYESELAYILSLSSMFFYAF